MMRIKSTLLLLCIVQNDISCGNPFVLCMLVTEYTHCTFSDVSLSFQIFRSNILDVEPIYTFRGHRYLHEKSLIDFIVFFVRELK